MKHVAGSPVRALGRDFFNLTKNINTEQHHVLEVGSREVTGPSSFRGAFSRAKYTGIDYYPGAGVDVIGDAHKLSSYFQHNSFDLVISYLSFEHFAHPWVVSREISKVLKIGGVVFIETHFLFPAHDEPWHFFHFTDVGLKVLFPPEMGFECVSAGMYEFSISPFCSNATGKWANLCVNSTFVGKKIADEKNFEWNFVDFRRTVGQNYPHEDLD